jgi:hypothetical protein
MAVADIKPLLVALALGIADHVLLPLLLEDVGRQILVIRRCESWSSATNIRNPEVHMLWSTWAKGILQVRNRGKGFNKVSRVFFMLSFQLSPGSRQKESFHV